MFFAEYENGQVVKRETANDIFALPGKYSVFKYDNQMIQKALDATTLAPFCIHNFEITRVRPLLFRSDFEVYDHTTKKSYELRTVGGEVSKVIKSIIADLEYAGKFPSFDIYLEYEDLKRQSGLLKNEIKKLNETIRKLNETIKKNK